MRSGEQFDPVDAIVKNALSPDRASAERLAQQALDTPDRGPRRLLVPALAAFALVVAGAVGVSRYAEREPPIVIRGEAGTIVIERGSGRNKTIETLRDEPATGGIVVIREGGNR